VVQPMLARLEPVQRVPRLVRPAIRAAPVVMGMGIIAIIQAGISMGA